MYYFAYGSNLSHSQMAERCPLARPYKPAVLPGYRMDFFGYSKRWGGAGACLQAHPKTSVTGGLYEVTDACLASLDIFEGVPNIYQRQVITVETDSGKIDAITYMKAPTHYEPPSLLYLQTIITGCHNFGIASKSLSESLIRREFELAGLFVYGTLKTNAVAHRLVSPFCLEAEAAELQDYTLLTIQGLQAIHFAGGKTTDGETTAGELLHLDPDKYTEALQVTDDYERFYPKNLPNSLYARIAVNVRTSQGNVVTCWAYAAAKKLLAS